jgi:hypothetical protein
MSTTQRRQPVSYAELQEVRRTGVFPTMGDPVAPGEKPYCHNCTHWSPQEDGRGECMNKAARKHALFGDGMLGSVKRLTTGGQCHCPEHEMKTTL